MIRKSVQRFSSRQTRNAFCAEIMHKTEGARKKSPPVTAGEKFKGGSAIDESAVELFADSMALAIDRKTTVIGGMRMLATVHLKDRVP